jgi:hypothetical protein
MREESKIHAIAIKFLAAIMGKTKRVRVRNAHTKTSSGWMIHSTKSREID